MSAVKTAISHDSTALPAGGCEWSAGHFFKVPNFSDETFAKIEKASAWPALIGILRAMNDQGVRGRTKEIRTAAKGGKISVGLHALARVMQRHPATVRKQVRKLAALGLVVIHQPAVMHVHDPDTGKIVSKRLGRTPPCTIILTITDDHLRPRKAKSDMEAPAPLSGDVKGAGAPPVKGAGASPSKESQRNSRQRRPSATCGVGRPDAAIAGRLAAAAPEPAACRPFEGGIADAFAATQARLAREKAERDAEDERLRQDRLAAEKASQDEPAATVPMTRPKTKAETVRELQVAVTALPAASKAKAKRVGRKIEKAAQTADEDAKALQRAIDAKRAAEGYRDDPAAVGRIMACVR